MLFFWFLSCADPSKPVLDDTRISTEEWTDYDGDGYLSDEDCDDSDGLIYPDAVEICDGIDNNCDGQVDEDVLLLFYLDDDQDGFGDSTDTVEACQVPVGYAPNANDCDDGDDTVYPSAPERCDGVDNDCDDSIDEDLQSVWFRDADGDGFGDVAYWEESCSPSENFVADSSDCDDVDPDIYPDAPEICDEIDNNCDGEIDEDVGFLAYVDADQDGFGDENNIVVLCEMTEGYSIVGGDCDDIDSLAYPNAPEICDNTDNNCDGDVDEGVGNTGDWWYFDGDNDGYGNSAVAQMGCFPPNGYVAQDGDCDDTRSVVHPNASEICDTLDNNCDGTIDDLDPLVIGQQTFFQDLDVDGFGSNVSQTVCFQPSGYVSQSGDCDDAINNVYPNAPEICDNLDNNCDSLIDDSDPLVMGQQIFYQDLDTDGFGSSISQTVCFQPSGYVSQSGDCDDGINNVYPNAPEICDNLDNNCDSLIDDADPLVMGQQTFYQDLDVDGFGSNVSQTVCFQPSGYVSQSGDCNDGDTNIKPTATEICDAIDNNCNNLTDDADIGIVGQQTFYQDLDTDGFGSNVSQTVCFQPSGYVSQSGDCNDGDINIKPTATEICDAIDNNCNNLTDDADIGIVGQQTFYQDLDTDGFGSSISQTVCFQPSGYVSQSGDCNDGDINIKPTATEICDTVDNNCNNLTDDADIGVVGQSTFYFDGDGDTYGVSSTVTSCFAPNGYTFRAGDCNDGNASISPGNSEVCGNGIDENCNGVDSEGCSNVYYDCGGPGAMQPGVSLGCGFGTHLVNAVRVSCGCNDGETGNYTISFNDGSSVNFSAGCNTTVSISPRVVSSATIYMNSGGGGDNNISWGCCGSGGWGVYYY